MQFVITAYDGEGMLDKRMEVRPLHLQGMERLKKHLIAAGGLLGELLRPRQNGRSFPVAGERRDPDLSRPRLSS